MHIDLKLYTKCPLGLKMEMKGENDIGIEVLNKIYNEKYNQYLL